MEADRGLYRAGTGVLGQRAWKRGAPSVEDLQDGLDFADALFYLWEVELRCRPASGLHIYLHLNFGDNRRVQPEIVYR